MTRRAWRWIGVSTLTYSIGVAWMVLADRTGEPTFWLVGAAWTGVATWAWVVAFWGDR